MFIGYNLDNTDRQKEANMSCTRHLKRAMAINTSPSILFPSVCVFVCLCACFPKLKTYTLFSWYVNFCSENVFFGKALPTWRYYDELG